jgi:hypothetical protein
MGIVVEDRRASKKQIKYMLRVKTKKAKRLKAELKATEKSIAKLKTALK